MVNVALIGCGVVAKNHLFVYKHMKNANVIAVSDIDFDRASKYANKFKIAHCFENYRDLLALKELELVDICTPTSTHAEIVCETARSGRNILLEKPMARTSAECRRMISETERHGVKLCICHDQRFWHSIAKAKLLADSGYYNILSFRTSFGVPESERQSLRSWNLTPEEGGILWEGGVHSVYIHLYFLKEITSVYAIGSKLLYPTYDNFAVVLNTPNESYGILEYTLFSRKRERACVITCTDGKRALIDLQNDVLIDESRARERFSPALPNKTPSYLRHFILINSYIEAIEKDYPPPVDPIEGKRTIEVLEAIQESLDKKEPVRVR